MVSNSMKDLFQRKWWPYLSLYADSGRPWTELSAIYSSPHVVFTSIYKSPSYMFLICGLVFLRLHLPARSLLQLDVHGRNLKNFCHLWCQYTSSAGLSYHFWNSMSLILSLHFTLSRFSLELHRAKTHMHANSHVCSTPTLYISFTFIL